MEYNLHLFYILVSFLAISHYGTHQGKYCNSCCLVALYRPNEISFLQVFWYAYDISYSKGLHENVFMVPCKYWFDTYT